MPADSQSSPRVIPIAKIRGWRLFLFYSSALLLTGAVSMLFADLLSRTGWSNSRTILLALFVLLFFLASAGCMHGIFGFFTLIFGDRLRITQLKDFRNADITDASTAI